MNESDLNHWGTTTTTSATLATTTTTTTTTTEEEEIIVIENGNGKEYYHQDILYNHNHNTVTATATVRTPTVPVVQKRRSRKTNPQFGTLAEAQAAEDLELQKALAKKNELEQRERRVAARNVFIPTTLNNYIPLTSLSQTSRATLIHSSSLVEPEDKLIEGPISIRYFAQRRRPCEYSSLPENVTYEKGSLIFVHKLFPFKNNRVFFITIPWNSTTAGEPHKSTRIKVSRVPFVQNKLDIIVGKPKERPFDSLFGWKKEPSDAAVDFFLQSQSDSLGITNGLQKYLEEVEKRESSEQAQVQVRYDSVSYVSECGEEEIDFCVDVTASEIDPQEQEQEHLGILSDPVAVAESNELYLKLVSTFDCNTWNQDGEVVLEAPILPNISNNHNNNPHPEETAIANYVQPSYLAGFVNAASVAIPRVAAVPARKNKRKQLVSTSNHDSSIVPDTIETNGVGAHVPVPPRKYKPRQPKTGSLISKKKDPHPGMENRPRYLLGQVARCPQCGISSADLHKCERCKKLIPAHATLLPDPFTGSNNSIPPEAIKRKNVRAPPKEEIVVLSSDDEGEEELVKNNNKEKEMHAPAHGGNGNMGTNVNVNFQKRQGGKAILQPKKAITPFSPPIVKPIMREQVQVPSIVVKTNETQLLSTPGQTQPQISSPLVAVTPTVGVGGANVEGVTELVPEDNLSPMPVYLTSGHQPRILLRNRNDPVMLQYQNGNIIPSTSTPTNNPNPNNPEPGTAEEAMEVDTPVTETETSATPTTQTQVPKSKTPEETIILIEKQMNSADVTSRKSPTFIKVECRFIRVGSYKGSVSSKTHTHPIQATVSNLGLILEIPHCTTNTFVKCGIPYDGVLAVQAHLATRLPLIVIQTTPSSTAYLRKILGMCDNPQMSYFYDPVSQNKIETRIIICMNQLQSMGALIIKRIFGSQLLELDFNGANQILVETAPEDKKQTNAKSVSFSPSGAATERRISITKTESLVGSSGAPVFNNNAASVSARTRGAAKQVEVPVAPHVSKELLSLTKPNSPIRMTLNSGDVMCLADEQFLNDQMIDFWLWWLSVSKMSEKDRERTHIFSTFFYKCLTTRPKRRSCAPWENDKTLSQAEKRHCRVKKWTKNVDIFSKDFIIVPINESAHWFLAVICFPGLQGICNIDDGQPRPDIKNRDDAAKKKRKVNKDEDEEPYVDPDRDEEAGIPEEEIESETDEEVLADAEEEAAAEEEAQKKGLIPDFDALLKRSPWSRHPPVKQPCIITFDSMSETRNRIFSTLRAYIRCEMKARKGIERPFERDEMPGYNAKVPDQPNHYDCGIYVLQYFESFFSKPLQSYLLPLKYLRKWFPESIVHTKRKEIYDAICEIVKTEQPENLPNLPALTFNSAPASAPRGPSPPPPGPSKAKRPKLVEDKS